jgi:hypothetical protein
MGWIGPNAVIDGVHRRLANGHFTELGLLEISHLEAESKITQRIDTCGHSASLTLGFSGVLKDSEYHELRRANWGNADFAYQAPIQDVVLSHGCSVARDKKSFVFRSPKESSATPLISKE